MSVEEAHRDATWVLTVVGGLALTKALEEVLPSINLAKWSESNLILILRLTIFLLISIRFFIGASVFFQKVHIQAGHSGFPQRNYILDFASSTILFSLLFMMAVYIREIPADIYFPHQGFFIALCAVLLYDWCWYAFSTSYDTAPKILKWAIPNTIAAGLCILLYAAFRSKIIDRDIFEIGTTAIIFVFSIPDLVRLSKGELP